MIRLIIEVIHYTKEVQISLIATYSWINCYPFNRITNGLCRFQWNRS